MSKASAPRKKPTRRKAAPRRVATRYAHPASPHASDTAALTVGSFGLADAGDAGQADGTHSARETERCRSLLYALLQPAWPAQAAQWAEALVAEFGSLPAALGVGTSDRARIVGKAPARFLAKVQAGLLHCLRLPLAGRPVISTSKQLLDYLKTDMANLITERFRVLFLTSQNELIADDLVWEGTVGEAPAYPREVVKRALEVGATGVILVHNHPSGSHEPSAGDVDATRRIAE
ncbi:MAG TPA: JAB domain-containing protein, partial [Allosphingosinicella sp.]|nr:JAB domain-containing protein [Allosphingosinicella sp.]